MKKIFLFSLLFLALQLQAQKFTIDLDSVSENKVFIKDYKWKGSKDTVMLITAKINGAFNTVEDSSQFNFNITFEGRLDSVKGVRQREKQLDKERENEVRRQEEKLLKLYKRNSDIKPELQERNGKAKQPATILIVPKNYNNTSSPPVTKKKRWWKK